MSDHQQNPPSKRAGASRRFRLAGAAGAILALSAAPRVDAQVTVQRPDFLTVQDRQHPEWAQLGLPVGDFIVLPRVSVSAAYDSNIYDASGATTVPAAGAAPAQPVVSDVIYQITPLVTVRSNWAQNEIDFSADAVLNRYNHYTAQNTNQYTFSGSGKLDIRYNWTLGIQAFDNHAQIPRSSEAYSLGSVTPLLYDQRFVKIIMQDSFSHFQYTADLSYQNYSYGNGQSATGQPISEAFQNRDTVTGFLRGDYTISPNFEIFALERVASSRYPDVTGRNQVATETLIGPNFELSHVLEIEFGAGYLTNSVDNPTAKAVQSADWLGQVIYLPTPLVTLTLTGNQRVVDTGLPNSPSYLQKNLGFQADYELLRNLIVAAQVGLLWYDYQGINRRDMYVNASLGATYYINRVFGLNLAYTHGQRGSGGTAAGMSFATDTVALTLVFQK